MHLAGLFTSMNPAASQAIELISPLRNLDWFSKCLMRFMLGVDLICLEAFYLAARLHTHGSSAAEA